MHAWHRPHRPAVSLLMHAVMHADGYLPVAGRSRQPRILTMPMLVKYQNSGGALLMGHSFPGGFRLCPCMQSIHAGKCAVPSPCMCMYRHPHFTGRSSTHASVLRLYEYTILQFQLDEQYQCWLNLSDFVPTCRLCRSRIKHLQLLLVQIGWHSDWRSSCHLKQSGGCHACMQSPEE